MDFELSEEHKMFQEAICNFAEKEIAPLVEEAEKTATFPLQLFPKMGKLGYLCVRYPAKYGGAEMGKIGDCISVEAGCLPQRRYMCRYHGTGRNRYLCCLRTRE